MENLRRAAFISIGRACGFAGLAIFCVMIGTSSNLLFAFRAGGIGMVLLTIILLIRARGALYQNHRDTEMWLILEDHQRPPEAYARWAATTVLRDAYLWFAQYAAGLSILLWVCALLISWFGGEYWSGWTI